jgi:arylsulfatase A-like enzyme
VDGLARRFRSRLRRKPIRSLAVAIAALVPALMASAILATSAPASPNVLFIVTDDQRLSGTMDFPSDDPSDPMRRTKQWFHTGGTLDDGEPFSGGTFFPNGIVTTPLCCPARASIFSGRYAHNHGVLQNDASILNLDAGDEPLQYLLQRAQPRYVTALFGKYLNGWNVWCYDRVAPTPPPFFDRYVVFNNSYSPACVNDQGTEKYIWRYSTSYFADRAVSFLDDMKDQDRPWFLYVAPYTPHALFTPEPKYANAPVSEFQRPQSYFEADRRDKPLEWQLQINDADRIEETRANQLRMLSSVDDLVDRIMTKLELDGQAKNTIAFFISDNGYLWGEHGLAAKSNPYPEAVSVPFYMRWPKWSHYASDITDTRPVANIDLTPTALDAIGGITPTTPKDGESLLDPTKQRNRAFTEYFAPVGSASWVAIKTPSFHYTEYYWTTNTGPDYNSLAGREYYDLMHDPAEMTNLLQDGDPKNDPPIAMLSDQLVNDRTCGPGEGPCPSSSDPALLPLDTKITRGPADDNGTTGSTQATFYFTSSDPSSEFECRHGDPLIVDALPFTSCQNGAPFPATPGQHVFEVRAKYPSSTVADDTPASYAWTVDTSAPETTITSAPPERDTSNQATFTFESSDLSAEFNCRLETDPDYLPCDSPYTRSVSDAPESAPHTLLVQAVAQGIPDPTPAKHVWSVDATPPDTTLDKAPPSVSRSREATFEFSSPETQPGVSGSGPSRFECKLDDRDWSPCKSPKTYTGLTKTGPKPPKTSTDLTNIGHTFMVRAFDLAGNADPSPAVKTWRVSRIQSFNAGPDTLWPQVTGTEVRSIVPDGCGGWYVGGTFTQVGGANHPNIAHINRDRSVDEDWSVGTDGAVMAMLLWQPSKTASGTLYIGGSFTTVSTPVDGQPVTRNRLAAVTTPACGGTGAGNVAGWNPNASDTVFALAPNLRQLSALSVTLQSIYAGGTFFGFTDADGIVSTRSKLAELNLTDGTPTSWNPDANPEAVIEALAVTPSNVYAGGEGLSSIGGAQRRNLAEIDKGTGLASSWNPSPDNTVTALKLNANYDSPTALTQKGPLPTIYVGGAFTTIGKTPVPRSRAAEINLADDGEATPWNPSLTEAGSHAFAPIGSNALVIGGAFDRVQGISRSRLAETDRAGGVPNDWDPTLDEAVYSLAFSDPLMAVGGLFANAGGAPQSLLAFYCTITGPQSCLAPPP